MNNNVRPCTGCRCRVASRSLLVRHLAVACRLEKPSRACPLLSPFTLFLSLPIPSPALSKPPVSSCCRSHWLRPGSPLLDSLLDTPPSEARCRQRCCPWPPHAQPALVQYNATDASPCHCHSRPPPRHAAHARGWTFPGQCRPSQSPVRVRVGRGLPRPCSSPPAPSLSAETASSRTSSAVNPRQGLHARIREKGRVFL